MKKPVEPHSLPPPLSEEEIARITKSPSAIPTTTWEEQRRHKTKTTPTTAATAATAKPEQTKTVSPPKEVPAPAPSPPVKVIVQDRVVHKRAPPPVAPIATTNILEIKTNIERLAQVLLSTMSPRVRVEAYRAYPTDQGPAGLYWKELSLEQFIEHRNNYVVSYRLENSPLNKMDTNYIHAINNNVLEAWNVIQSLLHEIDKLGLALSIPTPVSDLPELEEIPVMDPEPEDITEADDENQNDES